MDVTPLHIILAVLAVFIIFGPKRLPGRKHEEESVKLAKERVNVRPAQPILRAEPDFGHGHAAERPLPPLGRPEGARPQFSKTDTEGSPLPHEMLRV